MTSLQIDLTICDPKPSTWPRKGMVDGAELLGARFASTLLALPPPLASDPSLARCWRPEGDLCTVALKSNRFLLEREGGKQEAPTSAPRGLEKVSKQPQTSRWCPDWIPGNPGEILTLRHCPSSRSENPIVPLNGFSQNSLTQIVPHSYHKL